MLKKEKFYSQLRRWSNNFRKFIFVFSTQIFKSLNGITIFHFLGPPFIDEKIEAYIKIVLLERTF